MEGQSEPTPSPRCLRVPRVRVPHAVRVHVESELFKFPATAAMLGRWRQHLIDGPMDPHHDEVRSQSQGQHADPTLAGAVRLLTNAQAQEMERFVRAIEGTHQRLPGELRLVMEQLYWGALPWQAVCERLCVERRTLTRYRSVIIADVAMRLGWLW